MPKQSTTDVGVSSIVCNRVEYLCTNPAPTPRSAEGFHFVKVSPTYLIVWIPAGIRAPGQAHDILIELTETGGATMLSSSEVSTVTTTAPKK